VLLNFLFIFYKNNHVEYNYYNFADKISPQEADSNSGGEKIPCGL